MPGTDVDVIIVGAGLSGCCVAWELQRRKMDFRLIDGGLEQAASKVSAGLMTPITGKRLVKSWKWDEFWPIARTFYESVAPDCFKTTKQLRLFRSAAEQELFVQRNAEYSDMIVDPMPQISEHELHACWGGFEMSAGRLHVWKFVQQTARHFADQIQSCELSPQEILLRKSDCEIPSLNLRAKHIVCCQGLRGADSPWFPLRFNPAKGEILKLHIPGFHESRVINSGLWVAPDWESNSEHYHCGATYEWDDLTPTPTQSGRAELERRLKEVLKLPFEVIDHVAGVRPALLDSRPVCGVHPQYPQLAILNGLGSKGALQAPLLARQLIEDLNGAADNDPEFFRVSAMNVL